MAKCERLSGMPWIRWYSCQGSVNTASHASHTPSPGVRSERRTSSTAARMTRQDNAPSSFVQAAAPAANPDSDAHPSPPSSSHR